MLPGSVCWGQFLLAAALLLLLEPLFSLLEVIDLFPASKGSELLSADMWSRLTSETKWPHVSWS